ncbi:adenosine receptor A1, partial [Chanos chanos]|uniref:Adenosine receptor A1 n=1 Tax=Chanos chanos TaxID=29144 RepID=A0A6J2UUF0_CHACN
SSSMAWLAYTMLEILVAMACCFGNVLVMWAVHLRRSLRQPTFCFVVSLAIADFLVGSVAVPLAVLVDGWIQTSFHICLLVSCIVLVLTQASVLSLLAIAVDRYLRVSIPLRYREIATQRHSWSVVAVCWLLSCVLGFTPLFGWHNGHALIHDANSTLIHCTFLSVISLPYMVYFNYLGCIMCPLVAMTILYALVFHSLWTRLHKEAEPNGGRAKFCGREKHRVTLGGAEMGVTDSQAFLMREKRLALSLVLVLLLFAGCWMPLHLMNCAVLAFGYQAVPQWMFYAGILLSHANSAVNPVVYAMRVQKIREAYTEIWNQCVSCLRGQGGSTPRQRTLSGGHNTGSDHITTPTHTGAITT